MIEDQNRKFSVSVFTQDFAKERFTDVHPLRLVVLKLSEMNKVGGTKADVPASHSFSITALLKQRPDPSQHSLFSTS